MIILIRRPKEASVHDKLGDFMMKEDRLTYHVVQAPLRRKSNIVNDSKFDLPSCTITF